jgi:hypothetical protein
MSQVHTWQQLLLYWCTTIFGIFHKEVGFCSIFVCLGVSSSIFCQAADIFMIILCSLLFSHMINPSTYGDLIPTSYCDVRRFPAGYLNLELNFAGVYAN